MKSPYVDFAQRPDVAADQIQDLLFTCEGGDDCDPATVREYRVKFIENPSPTTVRYCETCRGLAAGNWSGEVEWIEIDGEKVVAPQDDSPPPTENPHPFVPEPETTLAEQIHYIVGGILADLEGTRLDIHPSLRSRIVCDLEAIDVLSGRIYSRESEKAKRGE